MLDTALNLWSLAGEEVLVVDQAARKGSGNESGAMVMRAAAATLAAVAALCALVALTGIAGGVSQRELLQYPAQQAQFQMLPEFQVSGSMQSGEPAPQGIPLSVQLPFPLPAPSPPAPTVITVGDTGAKGPVCKRCEKQMRKIKVGVQPSLSSPPSRVHTDPPTPVRAWSAERGAGCACLGAYPRLRSVGPCGRA